MKRTKAIKEKNPIKKMLRVHKEYCKMNEYSLMDERNCTCGRDAAQILYSDIEDFLLMLDAWLEENDSVASNSVAHNNLDHLIARLA